MLKKIKPNRYTKFRRSQPQKLRNIFPVCACNKERSKKIPEGYQTFRKFVN